MNKLLVGAALFLMACPQVKAEEWQSGFGQGYMEYRIQHGPGNEFIISCDEGASMKTGSKSSIIMQIVGVSPKPNTSVDIILDGDEFTVGADKFGGGNLDCHACYDNFRAMWARLRTAKTMLMKYSDGSSVKFDMKGARKTLPAKPCKTPFEAF